MKKIISTIITLILIIIASINVSATTVEYTSLAIPNINSSFKTYMDYRAITNTHSPQYKLIKDWGWVDNEGFMRCNGERNLNIQDDYYYIALGSYYGTKIGTKYRITLLNGKQFYGILGDCKADKDTDRLHMYSYKNDVGCPVSTNCSRSGCYRYICCDFPKRR